jgi:4'-phosphopantetheinyl transferase
LIGFAQQREIGVDLEIWRSTSDEAALVRRYFSPLEVEAYFRLDIGRRSEGFFNGWTRKEAYLKAMGRGLGLPLDSFDVSLAPDEKPALLRASDVLDDGRHWTLAAVDLGAGVSAAIVLEGDSCHIQLRTAQASMCEAGPP